MVHNSINLVLGEVRQVCLCAEKDAGLSPQRQEAEQARPVLPECQQLQGPGGAGRDCQPGGKEGFLLDMYKFLLLNL